MGYGEQCVVSKRGIRAVYISIRFRYHEKSNVK
jgi:hypothetical protein